ncbi:hypothetical protein PINS_up008102 [Pythium insidiosum]|nr:hypothetical protein PINS_up008102 [Pythium insidiosum]
MSYLSDRKTHPLERLFGPTLVARNRRVSTRDALRDKRVIGVFFTAAVCQRCQHFTPALATVYRNLQLARYKHLALRDDLEVVMVSVDANALAFHDYLVQNPFLALPLCRRDLSSALLARYQVSRIPTVVFVDGDGEVIERNGRALVEGAFNDVPKIAEALANRHNG